MWDGGGGWGELLGGRSGQNTATQNWENFFQNAWLLFKSMLYLIYNLRDWSALRNITLN